MAEISLQNVMQSFFFKSNRFPLLQIKFEASKWKPFHWKYQKDETVNRRERGRERKRQRAKWKKKNSIFVLAISTMAIV